LPDIAHWKYNFLKSKKKILLCCAARGHALAVCTLLAPLRSTSSSKRAPPARNQFFNLDKSKLLQILTP
jgi:hypothetical protein